MDKDVVNAYLDSSRSSFEELCVFLSLIIKHKESRNVGDDHRTPGECADLAKMFNCLPAEVVADVRIDIDRSFCSPVRNKIEQSDDAKKAAPAKTQACALC
jgi:hypothetical protein